MTWSTGRLLSLAGASILVLAACGSPSYADLEVGDCVIGNPGIEDMYERIDCSKARPYQEVDDSGDWSYKVVGKAPESDYSFSCGFGALGIADGKWALCFVLIAGR